MLAVDTNIIVRFITADEPRQSARARMLIASNEIFVATTVLLESEWVLRTVYKFAAAHVADALASFAGLPGVTLERPQAAAEALKWMRAGMDFADALHLAAASGCEGFVSFDEGLARKAKAAGALTVRQP